MKVALSEILWTAANEWLSMDEWSGFGEWSCNAALMAENAGKMPLTASGCARRKGMATDVFLRALGCPTGGLVGQFRSFERGPSRQGVRYMWLLLAMHVAEDEQIMVEVAK